MDITIFLPNRLRNSKLSVIVDVTVVVLVVVVVFVSKLRKKQEIEGVRFLLGLFYILVY